MANPNLTAVGPGEKELQKTKPTNPYKGKPFDISERAKELFEREQGIRYALRYLSEQVGKANAAAWQEVFKQHPELDQLENGMFAVFEEEDGKVHVIDPNDTEEK